MNISTDHFMMLARINVYTATTLLSGTKPGYSESGIACL